MTLLRPHTPENFAYYTFLNIIGFFVNMGVVFGPSIGYITQSLKFYRLGSSYGFNLTISLKIWPTLFSSFLAQFSTYLVIFSKKIFLFSEFFISLKGVN